MIKEIVKLLKETTDAQAEIIYMFILHLLRR